MPPPHGDAPLPDADAGWGVAFEAGFRWTLALSVLAANQGVPSARFLHAPVPASGASADAEAPWSVAAPTRCGGGVPNREKARFMASRTAAGEAASARSTAAAEMVSGCSPLVGMRMQRAEALPPPLTPLPRASHAARCGSDADAGRADDAPCPPTPPRAHEPVLTGLTGRRKLGGFVPGTTLGTRRP